jgi:hypothetical protein
MQTYLETQENLSALHDRAHEEGEIRIRRYEGQVFVLKVETSERSALDAAGIDLGISTEEIGEFAREGVKDYKSFEHNVRHNRYDKEYLPKLINVW